MSLAEAADAPRLVAFYLPQFHPIELNDRSHGPGFTEWTHVARATPLYRGHSQPVHPGELGYYDLRLSEVRHEQSQLALDHGIDAFCYWHYWSDGERIMERPLLEVLASSEPAISFCLGWANHQWFDVKDPERLLFEQTYPGPADDEAHFRAIEASLHDPRYLRVDGKPVFYLFRPLELPDLPGFVERWRKLAEESGLPGLHLIGQDRGTPPTERPMLTAHLDAMVQVATAAGSRRPLRWRIEDRLRGGPRRYPYEGLTVLGPQMVQWARGSYPCVLTNWDNTPRWERAGTVVVNPDPLHLTTMVRQALELVAHRAPEHQLVFVKSWNEWAEGNYLEPDAATGRARLEAVRSAIEDWSPRT